MKSPFASAFDALKPAPAAPVKRSGRVTAPAPVLLPGVAKSKHPDFMQAKVYMRKATHYEAWRKFRDEGGKEFSDLVEKLCREYAER